MGKPCFKYEINNIFVDEKRNITITDYEYREIKHVVNNKIYIQNYKYYKYTCNKCGWTDGWIEESSLSKGSGCSCCYGRKTVKGINDIATTHPEYINYFVNINDVYTLTSGSNKYVEIKCLDCGEVEKIKIYRLFNDNYSCGKCSDNISYPNKFMISLLDQLHIDFENEYYREWTNGKKYDFYFEINHTKYIVEMDGGFHNKPHSHSKMTLNEVKKIDLEKDIMAKHNDINIIRINCDYDNTLNRFEFIKTNIMNSDLRKLIDFKKVNWNICNEFAIRSLIKKVSCDYVNNISIKDISFKYHISVNTVRSYLKQASEIYDWVSYKPIDNIIANGNKSATYNPNVTPLICVETNEIFASLSKCEEISKDRPVKFYRRYVKEVCKNNTTSYKGYHFQYITKEKFNQYKLEGRQCYGDFFILPTDQQNAS